MGIVGANGAGETTGGRAISLGCPQESLEGPVVMAWCLGASGVCEAAVEQSAPAGSHRTGWGG